VVREILKVPSDRHYLFAGGLPAPELFPTEAIGEAYKRVLADDGRRALQYGSTEGYVPLREWIVGRLARLGDLRVERLLLRAVRSKASIWSGARCLIRDVVVTENPTYLAALQAFSSCEAEVVAVGSDDDGMCVEELDGLLARRRAKMIYGARISRIPRGPRFRLRGGGALRISRGITKCPYWRTIRTASSDFEGRRFRRSHRSMTTG